MHTNLDVTLNTGCLQEMNQRITDQSSNVDQSDHAAGGSITNLCLLSFQGQISFLFLREKQLAYF